MDIESLKTASETDLRDLKLETPNTENELLAIIRALVNREHDYGTCVYAMSIAAYASYMFVAHKLGVTGFQASCADMDIIKRTRRMDRFRIINYADLLYPQYRSKFDECAFRALVNHEDNRGWLKEAAEKLLAERANAHPDVVAHWKALAS